MDIPKKIQKLLDRREKLAMNLIRTCCELDTWLQANGADLTNYDIADSANSGCMIYCEPVSAKASVEFYILHNM